MTVPNQGFDGAALGKECPPPVHDNFQKGSSLGRLHGGFLNPLVDEGLYFLLFQVSWGGVEILEFMTFRFLGRRSRSPEWGVGTFFPAEDEVKALIHKRVEESSAEPSRKLPF